MAHSRPTANQVEWLWRLQPKSLRNKETHRIGRRWEMAGFWLVPWGGGPTSEKSLASSHEVAAGSTPPPPRATTKKPLFLSEHLFLARLGHSTLSLLCWPSSRLGGHKGQCVPAETAWPQKTLCTGSMRLRSPRRVCSIVRLPSRCNGEGQENRKDSRSRVPASAPHSHVTSEPQLPLCTEGPMRQQHVQPAGFSEFGKLFHLENRR